MFSFAFFDVNKTPFYFSLCSQNNVKHQNEFNIYVVYFVEETVYKNGIATELKENEKQPLLFANHFSLFKYFSSAMLRILVEYTVHETCLFVLIANKCDVVMCMCMQHENSIFKNFNGKIRGRNNAPMHVPHITSNVHVCALRTNMCHLMSVFHFFYFHFGMWVHQFNSTKYLQANENE